MMMGEQESALFSQWTMKSGAALQASAGLRLEWGSSSVALIGNDKDFHHHFFSLGQFSFWLYK